MEVGFSTINTPGIPGWKQHGQYQVQRVRVQRVQNLFSHECRFNFTRPQLWPSRHAGVALSRATVRSQTPRQHEYSSAVHRHRPNNENTTTGVHSSKQWRFWAGRTFSQSQYSLYIVASGRQRVTCRYVAIDIVSTLESRFAYYKKEGKQTNGSAVP